MSAPVCRCGQVTYFVADGRLIINTEAKAVIIHGTNHPYQRRIEHIDPDCGTCVTVDLRVDT